MATPMTAAQQLAQFKKWGITYHEHAGWESHNRNAVGPWGPVNGFVLHHTADDAADDLDLKVCWFGRSDLPGPLCQWGLRDDGTLDLIGNGRCNHAGGGDPAVLAAVVGESYGDYPPKSRYHEGSAGATDGNTHFYGCETYYSGGHPMTAAAYKTAVLLGAAICDFHGWTAKSLIGHKEWSDWKIDPGFVDMKNYRADVTAALKAGPGGQHQPPPPPPMKKPLFTNWQHSTGDLIRASQAAITDGEAFVAAHPAMPVFVAILEAQKADLIEQQTQWLALKNGSQ